jgi:hypothetical protein
MSTKQKVILTVVIVAAILAISAFSAYRQNFFLAFVHEDSRIALDKPLPVKTSDAQYKAIAAVVADHSAGSSRSTGSTKIEYKTDIDGDKDKDRIVAYPDKVRIRISGNNKKYKQRFLLSAKPVGVGFDDVDGDGKPDAWYALADKGTTTVVWGDGEGGFAGKQILPYGSGVKGLAGSGAAFLDVDKDGTLDLVFEETGPESAGGSAAKEYYWAKGRKSGK